MIKQLLMFSLLVMNYALASEKQTQKDFKTKYEIIAIEPVKQLNQSNAVLKPTSNNGQEQQILPGQPTEDSTSEQPAPKPLRHFRLHSTASAINPNDFTGEEYAICMLGVDRLNYFLTPNEYIAKKASEESIDYQTMAYQVITQEFCHLYTKPDAQEQAQIFCKELQQKADSKRLDKIIKKTLNGLTSPIIIENSPRISFIAHKAEKQKKTYDEMLTRKIIQLRLRNNGVNGTETYMNSLEEQIYQTAHKAQEEEKKKKAQEELEAKKLKDTEKLKDNSVQQKPAPVVNSGCCVIQ